MRYVTRVHVLEEACCLVISRENEPSFQVEVHFKIIRDLSHTRDQSFLTLYSRHIRLRLRILSC